MRRAVAFLGLFLLLTLWATAAEPPEDGTYLIGVALSGGSGRAEVETPAALVVTRGEAVAIVVWSSSNYEFMVVEGVIYHPVQKSGNSAFRIPVQLDVDMPVSASTIAMSEPHLIAYTLRFDSSTLRPSDDSGLAASVGIAVALAVITSVFIFLKW